MVDFKGLLLEGSRTNINTRSSIASTGWTNNASGTRDADALISPDGTQNATRLNCAANVNSGVFKNPGFTVTELTVYTASFFVKHDSGVSNSLRVGSDTSAAWSSGSAFRVTFNASTGAFSSIGSAVSSYSAEDYGNGWWRVQMTGTTIGGATAFNLIFYNNSATDTGSFGIYGVQVEQASFASSRIATAGSEVTRAADVATKTLTGDPTFNATEGTYVIEFALPNVPSKTLLELRSDSNNYMRIRATSSSTVQWFVNKDGGGTLGATTANTVTASTNMKVAAAYKNGQFAICLNGGTVATNASIDVPTVTTLYLGATSSGSEAMFGTIKNLVYYPERLPDAALVTLST